MEEPRPLADVMLGLVPSVVALAAAVLVVIDLWSSIRAGYKPAIRAGRAWLAAVVVVVLATVWRHDYWAQFALIVILLAWVLVVNRQFVWGVVLYLQDNLAQTFLLAVFYLMTWGWLFAWLGIPDLIWHESWRLRSASAVASTMVLSLFGLCAFYVGSVGSINIAKIKQYYDNERAHRLLADLLAPRDDKGGVDPLHQFLWVVQLPFLLLLLLPALFPKVFPYVPRLELAPDLLSYLATLLIWGSGIVTGVFFVKLALYIGKRFALYSDPFADALGTAGRAALNALAGVAGWLQWVFSTVWELLAAVWEKLDDPPGFQQWAWSGVKAAAKASWSWFSDGWKWLKGDRKQDLVLPPPKKDVPNPVEDRKAETRALFSFVLVVASFFVGLNLVDAFSVWEVPPGVALYALLALLVMVNALARILLPEELWYWRSPVLALLVLWVAWANHKTDRLQFENISYDPTAKSLVRDRVAAAYFPAPGATAEEADGLVSDACARTAWLEHTERLLGPGKPKLVVVSCSGGGARSLAWTSRVLDRLGQDHEIPGFDQSVRLITCGSAGAAGAAYYVKARYDQLATTRTPPRYRLEPHGWSEKVPPDCESPVVRSIALREVWRMFNPTPVGSAPYADRGRVLETSWVDLRQVPLEDLRAAERLGLVPSLVMAPVTLEDGRRMVISNLDLRGMVLSSGPELLVSGASLRDLDRPDIRPDRPGILDWVDAIESGRELYAAPAAEGERSGGAELPGDVRDVAHTNYSLSTVEFARVFDRAGGFRLATAARMSGALPMFTPAIYLPSVPRLRIIDSGYFDNYGVDLAAGWLFLNRDWIKEHTSGVILVQIRAMGRREARTGMITPERGLFTRLLSGYQVIESVAEGAVNAFSSGAIFRNDREVAWLSELFNGRGGDRGPTDFFTTVVFENTAIVRTVAPDPSGTPEATTVCPSQAGGTYGALTWRLTEADSRSIHDAFRTPARVASGEVTGLQLVEDRQRRLDEPNAVLDEADRARLTWELEQAQNCERFQTLRRWWAAPHEPGDAEKKPLPPDRARGRGRR